MTERDLHITGASVKVMKSFDYCHFEVCLSSDSARTTTDVDDLRKEAARLADKAVEQYKVAKENAHLLEQDPSDLQYLRAKFADLMKKPEGERTPKEKAIAKAILDRAHNSRPRYDYEDDFEEPEYDDPHELQDDDETLF